MFALGRKPMRDWISSGKTIGIIVVSRSFSALKRVARDGGTLELWLIAACFRDDSFGVCKGVPGTGRRRKGQQSVGAYILRLYILG